MRRSILAISVISGLLVGCGGGGSSSSTIEGGGSSSSTTEGTAAQSTSVKGVAIDGYLTGATAFLDYNFNGSLDAGEPSAVTDKQGQYDLKLEGKYADCADYAPIVIDVPVGAIDSDSGKVTKAYQLVYPPSFAAASDEDIKNTTPLTTVVWNSIDRELKSAGNSASFDSCEDVKGSVKIRNDITYRVERQEWRVANRYGVTVDELYSDFLDSENDSLKQLAVDLVPSLQKSYDESKTLDEANPNALYAYVEYFLGRWDNEAQGMDDKWYREERVIVEDGWTWEIREYSDDLSTDNGLVYKGTSIESSQNGIDYELVRDFEYLDGSPWCSINEFITESENKDGDAFYGIRNLANGAVADLDGCDNFDLARNTNFRILRTNNGAGVSSEHMYSGTKLVGFDNLVARQDTYQDIDTNELKAINFISTDFNDSADHGADHWARTKSEYLDDGTQVLTIRDMLSNWSRMTLKPNGIQTIECSKDGNSWTTVQALSQCSGQ